MSIDLFTGYILYFVIAMVVAISNAIFMSISTRPHFFTLWTRSSIMWVLAMSGVLIQTVSLPLGQVMTNTLTIIHGFFSFYSVEKLSGTDKPYHRAMGWFLLILAIALVFFTIAIDSIQMRISLGSILFSANFWASGVLLLSRRNYFALGSAGKKLLRILGWSFLVYGLLWVSRGVLSLFIEVGPNLYAQSAFNFIAVLAVPPVHLLINFGFIFLVQILEEKRKQRLSELILTAEGDASRAQLMAEFNHAINTPLGTSYTALSYVVDGEETQDQEELNTVIQLAHNNVSKAVAILEDRRILLERPWEEINPMDVIDFELRFNRILEKGFSKRHIRLKLTTTAPTISTSPRYLASLLLECCATMVTGQGDGKDYVIKAHMSTSDSSQEPMVLRVENTLGPILLPGVEKYTSSDGDDSLENINPDLMTRVYWMERLCRSYFSGAMEIFSGNNAEIICFRFQTP